MKKFRCNEYAQSDHRRIMKALTRNGALIVEEGMSYLAGMDAAFCHAAISIHATHGSVAPSAKTETLFACMEWSHPMPSCAKRLFQANNEEKFLRCGERRAAIPKSGTYQLGAPVKRVFAIDTSVYLPGHCLEHLHKPTIFEPT